MSGKQYMCMHVSACVRVFLSIQHSGAVVSASKRQTLRNAKLYNCQHLCHGDVTTATGVVKLFGSWVGERDSSCIAAAAGGKKGKHFNMECCMGERGKKGEIKWERNKRVKCKNQS